MKQIIIIYDDSIMPEHEVKSITGKKSFGDTIFKRISLKNRMKEVIKKNSSVVAVLDYCKEEDYDNVARQLRSMNENSVVVHLYSNYALADTKAFEVLLTKAEYMNEDYMAQCDGKPAMLFLQGTDHYLKQFESIIHRSFTAQCLETTAFMDLSNLNEFLNFITGGFDARFFNALLGDAYTVTKKSSKKEKIKSEYNFYYLLPDNMKMWFVMPFDYKEEKDFASYTMERYHMTDIAIRFVHGAVDEAEFKDILEKLFYFIRIRKQKEVSKKEAEQVADSLYLDKLDARLKELKTYSQFEYFNHLIKMGTEFENLEEIINWYKKLYQSLRKRRRDTNLVVGHGDLCFSNILYSKEANVLKLIDPKGALKEEELYTDLYYDLAKLSHSICGCYDFFNTGLYQISMDREMKLSLSIDANPEPYMEIFGEYLKNNGFDMALVRLYEASLFLSMLPYHMDQPGKVFGFIMNAIRILKEVEACTQD